MTKKWTIFLIILAILIMAGFGGGERDNQILAQNQPVSGDGEFHSYTFNLSPTTFATLGDSPTGSFYDTETGSANLSAGVLDFSLAPATDDFVNLTPGEENYLAKREVQIINNGSLNFFYKVKAIPDPQQTSQNCNQFTLTLFLENGTPISQNLFSFETGPIQFSDLTDDLVFKIGLTGEISGTKKCTFNLEFEAWQDASMTSGFFDTEILSNYVETKEESSSQPQADIVINEFLPNPDSNAPYPANKEFIELKNNSNSPVDVAGWKISEMTSGGAERKYTITTTSGSYTAIPYGSSTVIPAGGWLVLLLSDSTALNNNGDTVKLYDNNDNLIDSYTYRGATQENKSYARYPDGSENWYDPIPTPGGPNKLEPTSSEVEPDSTTPQISNPEQDGNGEKEIVEGGDLEEQQDLEGKQGLEEEQGLDEGQGAEGESIEEVPDEDKVPEKDETSDEDKEEEQLEEGDLKQDEGEALDKEGDQEGDITQDGDDQGEVMNKEGDAAVEDKGDDQGNVDQDNFNQNNPAQDNPQDQGNIQDGNIQGETTLQDESQPADEQKPVVLPNDGAGNTTSGGSDQDGQIQENGQPSQNGDDNGQGQGQGGGQSLDISNDINLQGEAELSQ